MVRVVQADEQLRERALADAGRADDRHRLVRPRSAGRRSSRTLRSPVRVGDGLEPRRRAARRAARPGCAAGATVTGSAKHLPPAARSPPRRAGSSRQDPTDEPHRPRQQAEQRDELRPASPSVTSPVDTRHEPTASSRTMPSAGSASSAGSKPARMNPACTRSSRSASAFTARRSVSASSRPSVFTIRAPSMLSCATAETSPIRSCARRAGPSIRRAKLRFMSASVGNSRKPITARKGSVAISDDHREHHEEDHAARERHRVAARRPPPRRRPPCARAARRWASPCGTASESSRYRSATRRAQRRHHLRARHPAVVAADHDPERPHRPDDHDRAATASQIFDAATPPGNAGCDRRGPSTRPEHDREPDRRHGEQERARDRDEERLRVHPSRTRRPGAPRGRTDPRSAMLGVSTCVCRVPPSFGPGILRARLRPPS